MSGKSQKRSSSLTWKLEEPSGSTSSDHDVGPAWVDADDQSSYPTGPVHNGRWLTRSEARALAEEHGLAFFEDDGRASTRRVKVSSGLDIAETNRKLRAAGIAEADLRLEESGFGDVKVWGTMLQSLAGLARNPDSPFTTAMVSMSAEEARNTLDQLVPQWRSVE